MEKSTGGIPFFCFSRYFHMFTYIRGAAGKRYERGLSRASRGSWGPRSAFTVPAPGRSAENNYEIGIPPAA